MFSAYLKFPLFTIQPAIITFQPMFMSLLVLFLITFPLNQDSMLFKEIVKGVFGEHADSSLFPSYVLPEEMSLLDIIKKTIEENGLSHHKLFEDKIMQLYQVSQINQGW